MNCPKCGKRMTKTEGGWSHVYDLSRYMEEGEELCTYFVKVSQSKEAEQ